MFEYVLPILSFFITIFVLFGNTWKENETGFKKLNIKGYIVLISAFLIMNISIYKIFQKNKEQEITKKHIYEIIAIHLWELEMQVEKIKDIKNERKSIYLKEKLNLLAKQLTRILELYKNVLDNKLINELNNLILFIENENLKLKTNYTNTEIITSLKDLICIAQHYRKILCNNILKKSKFCYERQGIPFMHFWDRDNDIEMKNATKRARETLPYILQNLEKVDYFSIKVPIPLYDGTYEHVWLTNIKYKNGYLVGKIGNYFSGETDANFGDTVSIKPKFITDWMAVINNKMYGNFTLFVVMNRMCQNELNDFKTKFKYKIPEKPEIPSFKKEKNVK